MEENRAKKIRLKCLWSWSTGVPGIGTCWLVLLVGVTDHVLIIWTPWVRAAGRAFTVFYLPPWQGTSLEYISILEQDIEDGSNTVEWLSIDKECTISEGGCDDLPRSWP